MCLWREMSNSPRILASGLLILVDLRVDKKIDKSAFKAIMLYNKDRIGIIINRILNIRQGKAGFTKRFFFFSQLIKIMINTKIKLFIDFILKQTDSGRHITSHSITSMRSMRVYGAYTAA